MSWLWEAVMLATNLTIGELSQRNNVSLRTLRLYEQRGLLAPSRIGQSRLYSEKDETRLQVILRAKRMGFTLAEIARIMDRSHAPERPAELEIVLTPQQVEAQIAELSRRRELAEAAISELRAALVAAA